MFSPALSKKQRSGPGGSAGWGGGDGNSQPWSRLCRVLGHRALLSLGVWSRGLRGVMLSRGMNEINVICADSGHLTGTLASGRAGEVHSLLPLLPPTHSLSRAGMAGGEPRAQPAPWGQPWGAAAHFSVSLLHAEHVWRSLSGTPAPAPTADQEQISPGLKSSMKSMKSSSQCRWPQLGAGGEQGASGWLGSTLPSVPGWGRGPAACWLPVDPDEERLSLRTEQGQSLAPVLPLFLRGEAQTVP